MLYLSTLKKLMEPQGGYKNGSLQPSLYPLTGFVPGKSTQPLGQIELLTTFEDATNHRTELVRFDVVDLEASFNAILGRMNLNRLCTAVHHNFLCMKIPGPKGVITVCGEQSSDRKTLYRHETKCAEKGEASKSVHVLSGTGESKTDHPERYLPKPLPEAELKETHLRQ
ncbi:uncharacterized protein LOC104583077 [Brachypodium distachyon]|uniref:uncharacterized protein LOC104583077 n=1 Tax=Brachypodium distachyon TaxID=15368 RepID=UPI00052FFCBB|nr:uncharacterized protein LOC104583077 [Brachypodium distachyon]|eukprot:XP_010233091.1 uncharacterized protein LOC104583077 [Brachypodium distachyon]